MKFKSSRELQIIYKESIEYTLSEKRKKTHNMCNILSECGEYQAIALGILSIPHNTIVDMRNVMCNWLGLETLRV